MEVIADTHVHLYPCHNADRLLKHAAHRLRGWAKTANPVCVLLLAEAGYHCVFRALRDRPNDHGVTARIDRTAEAEALRLQWPDGTAVWLVAGRQLVARERVEILALTVDHPPSDGQSAAELVRAVDAAAGVPVLAWAPGKWCLRRAAVVAELCAAFGPDTLWLGDSSLRPYGWPLPNPMRDPARRVLAGSDPLPFSGEEMQAGQYAIRLQGEFDPERPVTSLRQLLRSEPARIERVGRRNTPWCWARRLSRLRHVPPGVVTGSPDP